MKLFLLLIDSLRTSPSVRKRDCVCAQLGQVEMDDDSTDVLGALPVEAADLMSWPAAEGGKSRATAPVAAAEAPLPVLIVGGGIAGLAAAVALAQRKIPCLVFERDPAFEGRKQGYGMTLQACNALAELGVLEHVRKLDTASHEHWTFGPDGHVLGYFGNAYRPSNSEQQAQRGNIRVPREHLRKLLLDRLVELCPETAIMRWGLQLCRYEEHAERVEATFAPSAGSSETSEVVVNGSVLVGADGIKSIVRRLMTQKAFPDTPADQSLLSYLGVFLMLGISPTQHYLLDGRGFYTIDGRRRLFTMPFAEATESSPAQTMWQLSIALESEEEARALAASGPQALLARALQETQGWHEPVQDLISGSILEGPLQLWATPLYDFGEEHPAIPGRKERSKDTRKVMQKLRASAVAGSGASTNGSVRSRTASTATAATSSSRAAAKSDHQHQVGPRVTLIGDAAHPMSPFKGQGANQALRDGPLLAHWLAGALLPSSAPTRARAAASSAPLRVNVHSALINFEREMLVRAGAKVLASREAAQHYHSKAVLREPIKVAGVQDTLATEVLDVAAKMQVRAQCAEQLIPRFRAAIEEVERRVREVSALSSVPPLPSAAEGATVSEDELNARATLLYYCYVPLRRGKREEVAEWYTQTCIALGVVGRVRVAFDGINATLGGTRKALEEHVAAMRAHPLFGAQVIDFKLALSDGPRQGDATLEGCNFTCFTARLCQEVVTLTPLPPEASQRRKRAAADGVVADADTIDDDEEEEEEGEADYPVAAAHPSHAGIHLSPADYHTALSGGDPSRNIPAADVLIDVRNEYEHDVGRLEPGCAKMFLPPTRTFSEMPAWFEAHADELRDKTILMYCTGGVRCERASAYLRELGEGFGKVFQLRGGIHRYIEAAEAGKLPRGENAFKGKMFVFDEREGVPSAAPEAESSTASAVAPSSSSSSSSSSADVLGRCRLCAKPWDKYTWNRCRICGVLMLVCDACIDSAAADCGTGAAAVAVHDKLKERLLCRQCEGNCESKK